MKNMDKIMDFFTSDEEDYNKDRDHDISFQIDDSLDDQDNIKNKDDLAQLNSINIKIQSKRKKDIKKFKQVQYKLIDNEIVQTKNKKSFVQVFSKTTIDEKLKQDSQFSGTVRNIYIKLPQGTEKNKKSLELNFKDNIIIINLTHEQQLQKNKKAQLKIQSLSQIPNYKHKNFYQDQYQNYHPNYQRRRVSRRQPLQHMFRPQQEILGSAQKPFFTRELLVNQYQQQQPSYTQHEIMQKQFMRQRYQKSLTIQNKPCTCNKSKCKQKYCECFKIGIACNNNCKCEGCENPYNKIEHSKTHHQPQELLGPQIRKMQKISPMIFRKEFKNIYATNFKTNHQIQNQLYTPKMISPSFQQKRQLTNSTDIKTQTKAKQQITERINRQQGKIKQSLIGKFNNFIDFKDQILKNRKLSFQDIDNIRQFVKKV